MQQDRLTSALERISRAAERINAAAASVPDHPAQEKLSGKQRQAVAAALAELDTLIERMEG